MTGRILSKTVNKISSSVIEVGGLILQKASVSPSATTGPTNYTFVRWPQRFNQIIFATIQATQVGFSIPTDLTIDWFNDGCHVQQNNSRSVSITCTVFGVGY